MPSASAFPSRVGLGDVWTFPSGPGATVHRHIRIPPHLSVTKIESTVRSATDGHGVVWVLSHQIEEEVRDGRLQTVVQDAEPDPTPLYPHAGGPPVLAKSRFLRRFRGGTTQPSNESIPDGLLSWCDHKCGSTRRVSDLTECCGQYGRPRAAFRIKKQRL